jgi:heme exporter protein C
MTLIDLANPSRFLALASRILPWLVAATVFVLAIGLYQSATAPDDYQQGATVKIMSSTCRMRGCRCSCGG